MKQFKYALLTLAIVGQPLWAQDAKPAPAPLNANGDMEKWEDFSAKEPNKEPRVEGGQKPSGYWMSQSAYEAGKIPDFAVKGSIARDTQIKHGGEAAVRIEGGLPTDIVDISLPPFAVAPNTKYLVKVWIKGQNIALNKDDGTGAAVWVNTGPEKDFWTHQTSLLQQAAKKDGDFDWTPLEITVDTAADTGMMVILLQLRRASGTVWFDDLEVVPQEKPKVVESF